MGRRTVAASVLTALVLSVPAVSLADGAREADDACPAGMPDVHFEDVPPDSTHRDAIYCVAGRGIARGTSEGYYSPDRLVSRAQMASFIARTMWHAYSELEPAQRDHFSDDDGSEHEEAINRLAEAGIAVGTSDGRFRPHAPVTRAQMASFLQRTHDHPAGFPLEVTGDHFDDDAGSPHERAINAIASAGIAAGTAPRTYRPEALVRRDQMASFLTRFLDVLIERRAAIGDEAGLVPPIPHTDVSSYQFDGAHTGSVGVPEPPSQTLTRAWVSDLGGEASYALVADGTVLVVTNNRERTNDTTLFALRAATGGVMWQADLGSSGPWAAHAYADGRVFAVTTDGVVRAFDAATGSEVWSDTQPPEWGRVHTAPVVHGGSLYVAYHGSTPLLRAFDAATGARRWTQEITNATGGPAVTDDAVYVADGCSRVYAFDPADGTRRWHHEPTCSGGARTVVVHDDRVYVRVLDGNVTLDAVTGRELGTHPSIQAPAFHGGLGFATDARHALVAFDAVTGDVRWRKPAASSFVMAPIVVSGAVYAVSLYGELYAFDRGTGDAIWSDGVGRVKATDPPHHDVPLPGLTAGGGMLFVPTESGLIAYG